jgi:4'-phosphopantetheinyl transferase
MTPDTTWIRPPKNSQLKADQLHIWRGVIPMEPDPLLTGHLSFDEIQRAARFVRTKDKQCFLFSHGMLRIVIAYYIESEPQDIIFTKNAFGKLSLMQKSSKNYIRFNMAHSEDIVAVAVTSQNKVGIDVEFIRDIEDAQTIVSQNFSPSEQVYLTDLPQNEFRNRFFTCWTLKEAFIKAIGKGLSYPLEKFSVIDFQGKTLTSGPVILQGARGEKWYQKCFSLHQDYSAAVVVQNIKPELQFYDFNKFFNNFISG